jgi:hypothetical protein
MGKGRNPTGQIAEFSNNRLTNFSCLASDSESDSEVPEEVLESEVDTGSESEVSESESEPEEKPQNKAQEQNQFRVWKSEESRFSTVKNIFSSPFSKKKRRVKEEEWVSILGEQGQGQGVQEQSQGKSQSQGQDFSSLLNRNDVSEEQNALAWAEKVKLTLERAGQNRSELKRAAAKSEDTSTVSFFRRSIVLDENF